uniref:Putative terminase n=2 Tax=viral metagenome TaxID=1070528 RepID=A0A6M3MH17_9ZZZZ
MLKLRKKVLEPFLCLYEHDDLLLMGHYGGRSAAKSYEYADYMLIKAMQEPGTYLCGREYLVSIKDSVHQLMQIRIKEHGWEKYFDVMNTEIRTPIGGKIIYKGLSNDPGQIKGIPDLRCIWCEESVDLTEKSFDDMYHTILRNSKDGIYCRMMFTFNPQRDDDFMYKLATKQQERALFQKVYYYDNPYLSPEALKEIERMKREDYNKYQHIYLGEPIVNYDTLVYKWTAKNELEHPIDFYSSHPVYCSWDFGTNDDNAIIAWQVLKSPDAPNGCIIQIFDEIVNRGPGADFYRKEVLKKRWSSHVRVHYCDPTGSHNNCSLSSWVDKIGFNFQWQHGFSPAEMIDHANDYMPSVRINRHQCPRTFRMFRTWQYHTDKNGTVRLPLKAKHDEESHCGSAWYYGLINHFRPKYGQGAAVKLI